MLTTTAATPFPCARGAGLGPAGAQARSMATRTRRRGHTGETWFPPCFKRGPLRPFPTEVRDDRSGWTGSLGQLRRRPYEGKPFSTALPCGLNLHLKPGFLRLSEEGGDVQDVVRDLEGVLAAA